MKKIFFVIFIFSLIIVVWGQTMNPSRENAVEAQNTNKCSPIVEGLQFCSTSTTISFLTGQQIKINVFLRNTTDRNISILNGELSDSYNIVIKDAKGNIIASKMEKLNKLVDEGKAPLEDLIRQLPVNSSPRKINLNPGQELKIEFNLDDYYDLKTKGKYQINISRKIPVQNSVNVAELSFGKIEIEVK